MRSILPVLASAGLILLAAPGCHREKPAAPAAERRASVAVSSRPAVLSELADERGTPAPPGAAPAAAPVRASQPAAPAPEIEFVFADAGGGVAWVYPEDGKFRVAHNGRASPPYDEIRAMLLSPDGARCAYTARVGDRWRMFVDGKEQAAFAEIEWPKFSPDGAHLLYQAKVGERWRLVVDGRPGLDNPMEFMKHDFGAGSSRVVFVDQVNDQGAGRLASSDLSFGDVQVIDPKALNAALNAERTRIAAVTAADRQLRVEVMDFDRPDRRERGKAYDDVWNLEFAQDGVSVAHFAARSGGRILVVNGEELPLAASEEVMAAAAAGPGKGGFGALIATEGKSVALRQVGVNGGQREAAYDAAEGLVYAPDGRSHAYAARKGDRWFVVVDGKEGPAFDRVVSPAFSPDGQRVVYRVRSAGKRAVVIADGAGKTLRQLPAYEQVFNVRFTGDGRSIAYGVKDGRQLAWKVEPL